MPQDPRSRISIPDTPLGRGLRELLGRFEQQVRLRQPVQLYVAGGMAVHLYLGRRETSDVDAEFSARVYVPQDVLVPARLGGSERRALYFDTGYNPKFALMHPRYIEDSLATEWQTQQVQLRVLAPVDLAVSKVSRLEAVDRDDIGCLVAANLVTPEQIHQRAIEALDGCIGGEHVLRLNLQEALEIAWQAQRDRPAEDADGESRPPAPGR